MNCLPFIINLPMILEAISNVIISNPLLKSISNIAPFIINPIKPLNITQFTPIIKNNLIGTWIHFCSLNNTGYKFV